MSDVIDTITIGDEVVLTAEQQHVVDTLVTFVKDFSKTSPTKYRTLGGLAGTGKTTVIKTIVRQLARFDLYGDVAAYTGKAVSVLRKKGISGARTLHNLLYYCNYDEKEKRVVFYCKPRLEDCDFIIVDEASMVNGELFNDLMSFKLPVIFVGDYGQLEPIGDNPNLMQKFDLRLQQIHRQAELNPIIRFARDLRNGKMWDYGNYVNEDGSGVRIIRKETNLRDYLCEYDQFIVATNATRKKYNLEIRRIKSFDGTVQINEKLGCLKNDCTFGVFNGLSLLVESIQRPARSEHALITFKDEIGTSYKDLPVYERLLNDDLDMNSFIKQLDKDKKQLPRNVTFFNYGYAITCHKSQGSEWDSVIVYGQYVPMFDMDKWNYTAATRAARRLLWVR